MDIVETLACDTIIRSICRLQWNEITAEELHQAATAYYYFSIQFRENLETARHLYPFDESLAELELGECNTDNLSPWPGVAKAGEAMNHDEFMRRALNLSPLCDRKRQALDAIGLRYLATVRRFDEETRARSIASYEDGGLERVFSAMLTAPDWNNATLQAFHHFLVEHIRFDHDPKQGHGALARHLGVGAEVEPLWAAFHRMLTEAVPRLVYSPANAS